jgi:hypothetical protein
VPLYGYARVSSIDQDLRLQRAALKAAGCNVIRAEKASGSRRDGRTELQVLLDFVLPGDALIVTRIDRLARGFKRGWQRCRTGRGCPTPAEDFFSLPSADPPRHLVNPRAPDMKSSRCLSRLGN